MHDSPFHSVLSIQASLGECPLWDTSKNVLFWVDIEKPSLNCFDPITGRNAAYILPENIGCIGLRKSGGFIAGLRSGLWLLDEKAQLQDCIARPVNDTSISRFNDGRVDPWGGFWAGTIYEPRDQPLAKLFRVDLELNCRKIAENILVSNGVAFSPDRYWAYHSDTPNYIIYRYPLNPDTGEIIGPRTIFHQFPYGNGRPDGAAVDSDGFYWSALFEGGRIVRISPEGEIVSEYPIPAYCPTMCAFGGSDLKTLYVTSASHSRSNEELSLYPESGNIFAMRTDIAGIPEPFYAG